MKYAVVLSGYFDTISTGIHNSGLLSKKKIDNFFNGKDVDFYIHCWQPEKRELLNSLYSPKKIICEPQIDFTEVMKEHDISQEWFDDGFNRSSTMYNKALIHRSLSFFYSRKMALSLLEGNYDQVFIMRLDIGNVGPDAVNFPHRHDFSMSCDNLYSVYWEQLNCGLGDMWFICNQEDSLKISKLYDRSLDYFKKNSDYSKAMTEGWPDSEFFDFNSNDPRQFSNIVLSKKPVKDLMKYPRWYCVNNHSIYKYFFIENGLYSKVVYI